MTLIAAMASRLGCVLVADMLISSSTLPRHTICTPTMTIEPPADGEVREFYVSNLASKITFIGKNVAIAYAGRSIIAQSVIKEIFALFPNDLTSSSIKKTLDCAMRGYSDRELEEIDLIAIYSIKGEFNILTYGHCINHVDDDVGFMIAAGGSGKEEFLDRLGTSQVIQDLTINTEKLRVNPSAAIVNIGKLFTGFVEGYKWQQIADGKPSNRLFGGWFEVVVSRNAFPADTLWRVSNVAMILVRICERNGDRELELFPQIFFQTYIQNHLTVVRNLINGLRVIGRGTDLIISGEVRI